MDKTKEWRIDHHGDNHVSGLSGADLGPVVGVNYGTIYRQQASVVDGDQ